VAGWQSLVVLFLAAITISLGFADTTTDRILLPIEVLGANGTTVSKTVTLQAGQAGSIRFLWLQIHGVRYADQASIQINTSAWIPLNNNTVTIAEPGRSYGGIGGGFSTLVMTLPLPNGTVVGGDNTIRFRFNQTDGGRQQLSSPCMELSNRRGQEDPGAKQFCGGCTRNLDTTLARRGFYSGRAGTLAERSISGK
jgi:hypothetical protein